MTDDELLEGSNRPILNVVSTVKVEKSSVLKWQIRNFGLFLNSKAAYICQNFVPLNNIHFELSLIKRPSRGNEDDKLELALRNCSTDDQETLVKLTGQITLDGEEGWNSDFVMNFNDATHYFAPPPLSFDAASILTIGNMFFEHIIVETDVLSSWIMRLDDSFMMSRSTVELMNLGEFGSCSNQKESTSSTNAPQIIEMIESMKLDELECVNNNQSRTNEPIDNIFVPDTTSKTSQDTGFVESSISSFEKTDGTTSSLSVETSDTETETPSTSLAPKFKKATKEFLRMVKAPKDLHPADPYKKHYKHLDDEWLKSLDELIALPFFNINTETFETSIIELKDAYKGLYNKLRQQCQLFSGDFLRGFPNAEDKLKLDEIHVLIVYFEALLDKLQVVQFCQNNFEEDWELDDLPDFSQELKWIQENKNTNDKNFDEALSREICIHREVSSKFKQINEDIDELWVQYGAHSKVGISERQMNWIKGTQNKIDTLTEEIRESELRCMKLFISPVDSKQFVEIQRKLSQLQFNITVIVQNDPEFAARKMMEHDLKDLRNLIQRVQNKFRQFPELGVSEEVKVRFSCGIKRRLSDIRERIKSLDERITNPVDCLELDNMKDVYDQLSNKTSKFDSSAREQFLYSSFYKAVESVNRLHSSLSYTIQSAGSEALVRHETELCKYLCDLENALVAVGADLDQNATLRLNYEDAKKKADRIAVKLRERLEPWRQFMDLYTSIEQSDKTIQELVGQLDSKPDGGYHETCADIDLLMSMKTAFETTRKDITHLRLLYSAGQMKSPGLADEAASNLDKINNAHRVVESKLRSLLLKLRARTVNPFYGRGRGYRRVHRRQGGSYYDSR